ncbi:MAG: MFS transporter [Caldilineaceae bacterium]|nr:MFS transporter [Caldilineaceae bacterium]
MARTPIPEIHRRNFRHLYFEIAWFGIINGSLIAFASVYLTRVGATTTQLGWFSAIPALVALIFSLPAGFWLQNKKMDRSVFWSALVFRFYYLLWPLLSIFFAERLQVDIVLLSTVIMGVPGTLLAISFNALFAAIVPPEWRNHVIGIRYALLAIASVLSSLLCGALLDRLPFPLGYQLVFGLAAFAGAMSTLHLWFLNDQTKPAEPYNMPKSVKDVARPGIFSAGGLIRPPMAFRYLRRRPQMRLPQVEILRGDFGRAMLVIGFMYVALYLPNALYYPYWVDALGYSDKLISYGSALFYVCQFISATQLARVAGWIGNQKGLAWGAALLSAYPGVTAMSTHPIAYLLASALAGIGWGIAGGAILSYVLERVPDDQRPNYMAWYSLLTNVAILAGSLLGPLVGAWIGLRTGLAAGGVIRLLSGLVIWIYGAAAEPAPQTDGAYANLE